MQFIRLLKLQSGILLEIFVKSWRKLCWKYFWVSDTCSDIGLRFKAWIFSILQPWEGLVSTEWKSSIFMAEHSKEVDQIKIPLINVKYGYIVEFSLNDSMKLLCK